jgi:hypothetical protein
MPSGRPMSRSFRAPNTGRGKIAQLPSSHCNTGHRRRHYEHLRHTGRARAGEQFVASADAELTPRWDARRSKPTLTRTNRDGEARRE